MSGNPSGKSKVEGETRAFIQAACKDAARVLLQIAMDETAGYRDRSYAARTLLDFGLAKPTNPIEIKSDSDALNRVAEALTT